MDKVNLNLTKYELSLLLIATEHWAATVKCAAISENNQELENAAQTLIEITNKIAALK